MVSDNVQTRAAWVLWVTDSTDNLRKAELLTLGAPSVGPGPAALASPGKLLEMLILRPIPGLTKSVTSGVGPHDLGLISPPGDCDTGQN